ncbi:MAG TPA: hypothetical protein VMU10_12665 [Desulfomonilia bacterium]|nr:hypothetical protein [Desulfomonilia bacterium]
MKERPKLGRGLQDVSRFFLGDNLREEPKEEAENSAAGPRTIFICCPFSGRVQSVVTANLALELARNRHRVIICGNPSSDGISTSSLMRSILTRDENEPGKALVSLYGLPEIVIHENGMEAPRDEALSQIPDKGIGSDGAADSIILVDRLITIELLLNSDQSDEYIIITKADEKSLLQCYAYIKTIHACSASSRTHVVLDDVGRDLNGNAVFKKLAGFVRDHLGLVIHYLGCLINDEHLDRSITEERPLVLFAGMSGAKDSLRGICTSLLEARWE